MRCFGLRVSKAQDQGLEFWQTKSFAIMTYASILGDCIDRVTSQDGDRVIFERLETPRLAPKVTLNKNWQSQQQQHSTSSTDVPGLWKQGTKKGRPGWSTRLCGPLHRSVSSQEPSQAIFEMGNVELIELKTSRIQCPSCLHNVFKGTIICACGKHIRPDQEMIRRIKAALEILKAPYFRRSVVTARGYKHWP